MQLDSNVLERAHLSVLSGSEDPELARIGERIGNALRVSGRTELEELLCALLAAGAPPKPRTLDLIGHSTAGTALLVLGDWVIDCSNTTVTSFFRELAEQCVLPRLGITAVRLLGCLTADTGHGRSTITTLAEILGVEVFGTRDLVYTDHYEPGGFAHERRYLLVSASELRSEALGPAKLSTGSPYERVFDLDALPATTLVEKPSWPLRTASLEDASAVLRLIRRRGGAAMPGLLTAPRCELALPSAFPGRYHRVQILLEGELVRVYPDGPGMPGIVYPVDDATAMMSLVERLPPTV
jgi:hypothetical protein